MAGVGDGLGRNAGSVNILSIRSPPFECKATVASESSVTLSPQLIEFPSTPRENTAWIAYPAIVVVGGVGGRTELLSVGSDRKGPRRCGVCARPSSIEFETAASTDALLGTSTGVTPAKGVDSASIADFGLLLVCDEPIAPGTGI